MNTEFRVLRELSDGRVEVAEIWATGWQIVVYPSKDSIPPSVKPA